ncbi:MAG: pentapeptide repeat-containing protein [Sphingomonadales bacterium]
MIALFSISGVLQEGIMRVILYAIVIWMTVLAVPNTASAAVNACEFKELRKLGQDELKTILGQHKLWLALQPSMRDPGDERRANLCNAMMLVALLDRADLRLANLSGAYLADAHLNGAYLWGADLEGANLTGAELNGASLTRARLKRANLSQARLGCLNPGRPDERCADLREARLNEARLIEADLSGANLTTAKLERANLSGARLIGADLSGADLSGAILSGADLRGANLSGAKLDGANLGGADLRGADLSGAKLDGAGLGSANMAGAIFEPIPEFSPADLEGAGNLHLLRFVDSPEAMGKLRQGFREAGLRGLERQITYAIKKSGWRQAKEKGGFDAALAGITHVLFEMTTEWGLAPERALIILGFIWLVSAVFYVQAVFVPLTAGGGLYRDWKDDEGRWEFEKHKWEIKPEGDEPARNTEDEDEEEEEVPKEYDKEKWQAESENTQHWVEVRWYMALPWAFYFAFLSALSLGYGKYKLSSLLHGLGPHKYELRMSGWVRGPAAVQAVISSYLLAIWAITLLGRPFG